MKWEDRIAKVISTSIIVLILPVIYVVGFIYGLLEQIFTSKK